MNIPLRFAVLDRGAGKPYLPYPNVLLQVDKWDDFGFKTMYFATLRTGLFEPLIELGQVKILERGQRGGRPSLGSSFDRLGDNFCSLGQDIEYYENLMRQPASLRRSYLRALNDAAAYPSVERKFAAEPGWETSLIRFGPAVNALGAGRQLVRGTAKPVDQLSFQFDWWRDDSVTHVRFNFDASKELPGRCHVLIGYNGVGKTTLLADLALTADNDLETRSATTAGRSFIRGNDTTFGAVVAVSYSAFDTFRTPKTVRDPEPDSSSPTADSSNEMFGYVYCGLRRRTTGGYRHTNDSGSEDYELKSIDEIQSEFAAALRAAGNRESGGHLVAAFEALAREPSFGQIGIDIASLGSGLDSAGAIEVFSQLSTGHKIVLNIVTQLAAHLRTRSLVLIDEPETHLHPPLIAALLGAIQVLLNLHGSFAIIATHSPVVVQEIPALNVKILERDGASVSVREPEIETFAENIGAITRHVFSLDSSATDYQGILASLSKRYTDEQISEMFDNGLSVQGRALVANYRNLP
jgi:predicted ATPase